MNHAMMHDPNPEQGSGFPLFASHVEYGRADYERASRGRIHWHEDLQFIVGEEGAILVRVPGRRYVLGTGQVLFLNARCPHLVAGREAGTYSYILVPPKMLGFFPGSAMFAERVAPYVSAGCDASVFLDGTQPWHGEIASRVKKARAAIDAAQKGSGSAYAAALAVIELWFAFTRHARFEHLGGSDDRQSERLRAFVAFVQDHYAESVSVEDIAAAGNVSKVECGRVFREAFDISPHRYLNDYRLGQACEMLREGRLGVAEVAVACGFGSGSHFSNAFKRAYGKGPREWAKEARQIPGAGSTT